MKKKLSLLLAMVLALSLAVLPASALELVDAKALLEKGILSKCEYGVKILGNGSLTKKLTVQASAFSASAKEKIEAAGGKVEVV